MTTNTYNGWTNKQTWFINFRFEAIFSDIAAGHHHDVNHLADSFESLIEELEFEGLKENSLAQEAIGSYLDQVNWVEIAEYYFVSQDSEEDLGRYQAIADRLAN